MMTDPRYPNGQCLACGWGLSKTRVCTNPECALNIEELTALAKEFAMWPTIDAAVVAAQRPYKSGEPENVAATHTDGSDDA